MNAGQCARVFVFLEVIARRNFRQSGARRINQELARGIVHTERLEASAPTPIRLKPASRFRIVQIKTP